MSLMRYNPFFAGKGTSGDFFDKFFNRGISELFDSDMTMRMPSVNIREEDDAFEVKVAAPGLEKDDFKIDVEKGSLIITAEKSSEIKEEGEKDNYTRREFNYATFERRFRMPDNIKADDISASYEDGILNINLPKLEQTKSSGKKTIEIS